jgi:hypothetical protein
LESLTQNRAIWVCNHPNIGFKENRQIFLIKTLTPCFLIPSGATPSGQNIFLNHNIDPLFFIPSGATL